MAFRSRRHIAVRSDGCLQTRSRLTHMEAVERAFGPACFGDVLFPADVHECIARHVPRAPRTANRAVAQRRDRMTVWNAQVRFSHAAVRAKPRSAENSQSAESGQSGYDEGRNKSNGFVMACRRRGTFFARHAAERVPKRQSCGGKVEEREDHEQRVDIQAERVFRKNNLPNCVSVLGAWTESMRRMSDAAARVSGSGPTANGERRQVRKQGQVLPKAKPCKAQTLCAYTFYPISFEASFAEGKILQSSSALRLNFWRF